MKTRIFILLFVFFFLVLSTNRLLAQSWSSNRYTTQYWSETSGGTLARPQTFQYSNWVHYSIYTPYFWQNMNYYVTPQIETMVEEGFNRWDTQALLPDWMTINQSSGFDVSTAVNQLIVLDFDVEDRGQTNICGSTSPGCVFVQSALQSDQRNATYVMQFRMYLKRSAIGAAGGTVSDANWQAIITHEWGHILGLGDVYRGGACGTSGAPSSIMMGAVAPSNQWQICGALTHPTTSYDRGSITEFWKSGEYLPTISASIAVSGTWLISRWTDRAWAEFGMDTQLQRKQSGICCVVIQNEGQYVDIGTHNSVRSRTIVDTIPYDQVGEGTSFNLSGMIPGEYRICAVPFNGVQLNGNRIIGTWRCTGFASY